jgi:uncharacterized protein
LNPAPAAALETAAHAPRSSAIAALRPRSSASAVLSLARFFVPFLVFALAALPVLPARAADDRVPVPPLAGRVVDQTGTLSPGAARALDERLAAFEARKGSQVAVLIVPTTKPEAIEQYSIRVAEQWKLGRKKVDDGAILLVAKDDRAMRIEVGYGLEGALTDIACKRIISDIITPRFREGDFDGGITAGVDAMLKVIDGEPLPAPPRPGVSVPRGGLSPGLLFAALFIAWAFARGLAAIFGPMRAGLVSGGLVGGVAFLILKSLAFAAGLGFLAFILTSIFGSGGGLGGYGGRRRGPWGGGFGGFGGFGGGGWGSGRW